MGSLEPTATNARNPMLQAPSVAIAPVSSNVAPVGAIHAPSPEVARSGLALMIGTVFGRAVQYVRPSCPHPAPVRHYGLLTIRDVNPPDRALELPRYHFAIIDSEELLRQAKRDAQAEIRAGRRK